MIASQRAGELTFYDELGVARGATPEEIRDAFRSLVRLLHPDQQTDAQLKETAERQMRKLNRIYSVLSDPQRRRQYDDSLDDDYESIRERGLVLRPAVVQIAGRVGWAFAIACSAALLIWLITQSTPALQTPPHDPVPISVSTPAPRPTPEAAPASTDQSPVIARLRSDLKVATMERDAAVRELNRLRGTIAAPLPPAPAGSETAEIRMPPITMTELPSPAKPPVLPSAPPPRMENPAAHKLAGFWFYAKPLAGPQNKNKDHLYPPEYIEATITEDNGTLYGKYRSRFEIVDRAISPDVNFTFTGPSSNSGQVSLPWLGGGGAKGEVTIKLLSDTSMRIEWKASELGTQQGLNSGTAVLTRRIE
jgi:DnaJ domain